MQRLPAVKAVAHPWQPGENAPAIFRGTGGDIPAACLQVVGNLLWNCSHGDRHVPMASLLGCSSDVCAVVSKLSGVHVKTVRRLHAKLEAVLWEPREVRVGKRHAAQTLRRPEQDKRRQLPSPRLASATAARVTETKSEPGRLNVSASAGDSTNSSSNNNKTTTTATTTTTTTTTTTSI